MIKQYTTQPIFKHDADYPWYRPGYLPINTCDYPYHFPYFNSYPTYTVTTNFDCDLRSKKDNLHEKSRIIHNILVVFTILLFIYVLANLTL